MHSPAHVVISVLDCDVAHAGVELLTSGAVGAPNKVLVCASLALKVGVARAAARGGAGAGGQARATGTGMRSKPRLLLTHSTQMSKPSSGSPMWTLNLPLGHVGHPLLVHLASGHPISCSTRQRAGGEGSTQALPSRRAAGHTGRPLARAPCSPGTCPRLSRTASQTWCQPHSSWARDTQPTACIR